MLHPAIFGLDISAATAPAVSRLLSLLAPHCNTIAIEAIYHDRLKANAIPLPPAVRRVAQPPADTDIIVSVGGDGTFLRAVEWEGGGHIPVAGLNGGHLGYLTGWTLGETDTFVSAIAAGDYHVEQRALIEVECDALPAPVPYALNEVAVLKEGSSNMISITANIDGKYLTDYNGDGLIVSTPTGSTGYNLSVGGPILEPQLPAWVLSPVAPHALTMRPLVVSAHSLLTLSLHARTPLLRVSIDGRSFSVPDGTTVTLRNAPLTMPVVRPADSTFASTLREKLLWGMDRSRSKS